MVCPKKLGSVVFVSLLSTLSLLATGCDNNTTPNPSPSASPSPHVSQSPLPATLTSIQVTSSNSNAPVGIHQQFTATGIYSDNTTKVLTGSVTWSISGNAIGSFSQATAGLFTGSAVGSAKIVATDPSTGVSGQESFSVTSAVVQSLAIQVPDADLPVGLKENLLLVGTYSDGSQHDLTSTASWSSSAPASLSVSTAIGSEGQIQANGVASSVVITATDPVSGMSANTDLGVTAATLSSISISVQSLALPIGQAEFISASGTYSDGSAHDVTNSVNWSASGSSASFINIVGPGAATLIRAGNQTGQITVSAQDPTTSVSGSLQMQLTDAALAAIELNSPDTIPNGQTGQFTATGLFSDGTQLDITSSVTWTSSNTSALTIANAPGSYGIGQAVSLGSSTVTATDPITGVSTSASTTVVCNDTLTNGIQGGDGSSGNPYQICSPVGLIGMSNNLSSSYVLLSDIDMSGVSFSPIAQLQGDFNGQFHKILNLTVSGSGAALFQIVTASTVENLGLENVNVSGGSAAGLATLIQNSTISDVYVTGSITAQGNYSGGITSDAENATIQNCYAQVTFSGTASVMAGLVGVTYSGMNASNSYAVAPGSNAGITYTGDAVPLSFCYYDSADSTDMLDPQDARTDAQMQMQSNFVDWDFTNTWTMPAGGGYPVLQGF